MCACDHTGPCPRCQAIDDRDLQIILGEPDPRELREQAEYDQHQRWLEDVRA